MLLIFHTSMTPLGTAGSDAAATAALATACQACLCVMGVFKAKCICMQVLKILQCRQDYANTSSTSTETILMFKRRRAAQTAAPAAACWPATLWEQTQHAVQRNTCMAHLHMLRAGTHKHSVACVLYQTIQWVSMNRALSAVLSKVGAQEK